MRKLPVLAALGLTLALTACGAGGEGQTSPSPEPTEQEEGHLTQSYAGPRQTYAAALERLLREQILPTGEDVSLASDGYNMEENQFSVCDVDGDGEEELILLYTTIMTAGNRGYVYAWNLETGELDVQLETSPGLTFYESGAVQSDALHNQQLMSRDFWPYSLYRYDAYLDTYLEVGVVSAWGRDALENGYPEEADTSGTGFVYYISTRGTDDERPLDASIYEAWRYVYVRDGRELQPEYLALTEENIQRLLEE